MSIDGVFLVEGTEVGSVGMLVHAVRLSVSRHRLVDRCLLCILLLEGWLNCLISLCDLLKDIIGQGVVVLVWMSMLGQPFVILVQLLPAAQLKHSFNDDVCWRRVELVDQEDFLKAQVGSFCSQKLRG